MASEIIEEELVTVQITKTEQKHLERFRNKLGFLRVIQITITLFVLLICIALAFIDPKSIDNDMFSIAEFPILFALGIIVWLISKRKAIVKPYSIIVLSISIIYSITTSIINLSLGKDLEVNIDIPIFSIFLLYFIFSKKVPITMNRKFDQIEKEEDLAETVQLLNFKSLYFYRDLVIYFIVFSIVGHWMELIYCTILRYTVNDWDPNSSIWTEWLFPYMVYGAGVVGCIVLLLPIKIFFQKRIQRTWIVFILSFVINSVVCTAIEFITGLISNQNHQLWDYSDKPFNFMGQIYLQNALAFGVVATLMVWFLYPISKEFLARFNKEKINLVFTIAVIAFLFLYTLYIFKEPLGIFSNVVHIEN
jgi:uncharacterized membrane protein